MTKLKMAIDRLFQEKVDLPFSIYTSTREQLIHNVPITSPTLIFVLEGEKRLGKNSEIVCSADEFIFLSNSPNVKMRNIPSNHSYLAILIEFEYDDFVIEQLSHPSTVEFLLGQLDSSLEETLIQFVEWSMFAPKELWSFRRKELLHHLFLLGYESVYSMAKIQGTSHKLHQLFKNSLGKEVTLKQLSQEMNMSESTIRRKLKAEGTSIQEIKDQTKLAYALHLLQTTFDSIGTIADLCGFKSQSRFTAKFKQRFGITPSELRKTRLHEKS